MFVQQSRCNVFDTISIICWEISVSHNISVPSSFFPNKKKSVDFEYIYFSSYAGSGQDPEIAKKLIDPSFLKQDHEAFAQYNSYVQKIGSKLPIWGGVRI